MGVSVHEVVQGGSWNRVLLSVKYSTGTQQRAVPLRMGGSSPSSVSYWVARFRVVSSSLLPLGAAALPAHFRP